MIEDTLAEKVAERLGWPIGKVQRISQRADLSPTSSDSELARDLTKFLEAFEELK